MKLKKKILILFAVFATAVVFSACAGAQKAYHGKIMRGAILETSGKQAYLCIGSRDGAQVGQQLTVYRFQKHRASSKSPAWTRVRAGEIEITAIVDEHFAQAKVLKGRIRANQVAELE